MGPLVVSDSSIEAAYCLLFPVNSSALASVICPVVHASVMTVTGAMTVIPLEACHSEN